MRTVLLAFPPGTVNMNAWPGILSLIAKSETLSVGLLEFCEPHTQTFPPPKHLDFAEALGLKSSLKSEVGEQAAWGYNDFILGSGYQDFRFIALKMLNRVDLSGTFRFLDREVFLQAAILSTLQLLHTRRPDLVVFPVTPHEFLPFVVHKLAEFIGVKVLFFQPSPMSFSLIPKSGLDSLRQIPPGQSAATVEGNETVLRRSFEKLVDGTGPGYMALQVDRDRQVATLWAKLQALRMSIVWLFSDRFPNSLDFTGHKSIPGVASRLLKLLATRSLIASLREKALSIEGRSRPGEPYVVIALHYEPERTSLPEGLPIDSQADLIPRALKLFPSDTSVLVKEHYSQQTSALRGFAGRSPLLYDLLEQMPRTFLINPTQPLGPLIQDAQCVITLGGTVALEAVLRGVPVAYYGSPWWAGLPGAVRMTSNCDLSDIIGAPRPAQSEVLDFLLDLHRNSMIPGLGGEDILTTEKKIGPMPAGLINAEAEAVAKLIFACISNDG